MKIAGKRIILTGASSGIGKKILLRLKQYEDVKIVAVARNVSQIEIVEGVVYPFSADLRTKEGVDLTFEYAKKEMGGVDLFIANAGYAYLEKLENPDWDHIEDIFSLNVFSPIYALEKFLEKGFHEKHFVATLSGVAFVPLPHYALYSSTKSALHQFVEAYRYEKADNLYLTSVYPVATKTDFFDKAIGDKNAPLPWLQQTPDVVAQKIIHGIEKNKKHVYPSLLFRLFYPIGRAFPILFKVYSFLEKRKTSKVL